MANSEKYDNENHSSNIKNEEVLSELQKFFGVL